MKMINEFNEYINQNLSLLILIAVMLFLVFLVVLILGITIRKRKQTEIEESFDEMDGTEFEEYCAQLLQDNGYTEVELTPKTADFGVDIFAEKDGVSYAFQCKCYNHPVGTKAVQEIYAGRDFYHCMVGIVITNAEYTTGAKKLSEAFNIILWDGEKLKELERTAG